MKNRNPKIVKILDDKKLIFQCKKCSQVWSPMLIAGGKIRRGGWHCPNNCKEV